MNKFFEKFYSYDINGIDDFFDSDYDEFPDKIENIIWPLCYIIIGIPILIFYIIFLKVPKDIYPFSIANYIHAEYQNIINEQVETENNLKFNRWNVPKCEIG